MTEACLIIARVSSDDQRDGFSLDAQLDICREYAEKNGLPVERVFKFSESARGKKKRAEFLAVIDYLNESKIRHVVVEKMDRLLRNLPDYGLAEQIVESGVTIHLVKEGKLHKESTAHERLIFGFKALLAKSYSDNLSEEIKKGTKKKLESGIPLRRLYGYQQKEGRVEVIESQAEVVRRIYRDYLSGLNIIEIADNLNRDGIPAPRGPRWNNQTIHRTLTRPDYIGETMFRGKLYKVNAEPIVNAKDWHAVQKRIKTGNRKSDPTRWPLQGLIRFENGRLLSGAQVKNSIYYGAPVEGRRRVYVRHDLIIQAIDEAISATRWPERFALHVLDFARACMSRELSTHDEARKAARQEVEKGRVKLERLLSIYLDGELDRADYLAKKHDIEQQVERAKAISEARRRDYDQFMSEIESVAHVFRELPDIYAAASIADKVKILRAYVKSVVVSENKELLRLEYRQPFAAFMTPEILSISGSTFPGDVETSGKNSNRYTAAVKAAESAVVGLFYRAA